MLLKKLIQIGQQIEIYREPLACDLLTIRAEGRLGLTPDQGKKKIRYGERAWLSGVVPRVLLSTVTMHRSSA